MKFILLTLLTYDCSGSKAGRWTPAALEPLMCRPILTGTIVDPTRRREAEKKAISAGEPSQIQECRGTKCSDPLIDWHSPVIKAAKGDL